jgi:hypothetical protein
VLKAIADGPRRDFRRHFRMVGAGITSLVVPADASPDG